MGAMENVKPGWKIEGSTLPALDGVEFCSKGKERREPVTVRGKSVPSSHQQVQRPWCGAFVMYNPGTEGPSQPFLHAWIDNIVSSITPP